ncbi:MAG: GspE/PulE family protein [Aeoliella sp.]
MSSTTSSLESPRAAWDAYIGTLANESSAVEFVDQLLTLVERTGASDVHLDPTESGLELRWRVDGVLQPLGAAPRVIAASAVARLKVLAGLLTYETALPQEGRLLTESTGAEFRVSTFPTLFGERAALRSLGAGSGGLDSFDKLGLPAAAANDLRRALASTSGAVLIVGPAGGGKTTTAYAALREVVQQSAGGRAIQSLEDPIEVVVPGVAQSQVNEAAGFTMDTALKSLVRQDPEVLFLGEMRDFATAETTLQAALTGGLVVTTFHAGNAREALRRLVDMGIPKYAVEHAVRLIVSQRLVRRLCDCALDGEPTRDAHPLGYQVSRCRGPSGCERCAGTGYAGRTLLAEVHTGAALQEGSDDEPFHTAAEQLIEFGFTSPAEIVRVLGWR